MLRARGAAPYDRKLSMTNRSGAKATSSEACASVSERRACCAWIEPAHENLALGVDCTPQICRPPIDLQKDFVMERVDRDAEFGAKWSRDRRTVGLATAIFPAL